MYKINIVNLNTKEVTQTMTANSKSEAETIEKGILINLNTNDYIVNIEEQEQITETKESLINQFELTLKDFWGEKISKIEIVRAWKDFLNTVSETEIVPKNYYILTKEEKQKLYQIAEL